ncbi:DoxX family protein [Flavobacterium sp.]|uniref:DoxX family protein n=1 Tax=Flavobacterium sp. TaxID=239 RepID=UPI0025DE2B0B|nr:DoxX family protein [Flavobacterium sp.]
MKIATIIIRVLLGLFLLFASLSYFFKFGEQPTPTGEMAVVMSGFMATKYLFPLAKMVELLSGLSYVSGKFMKLFNLVLLPVSVNILFINAFLAPENLPVALFLLIGNLFLIYTNWETYKGIFSAN